MSRTLHLTKVAIYTRVSTNDKEQTPANQIIPLREYCTRMGWENPTVYQDNLSASKNRPQYNTMLERAVKGDHNTIIAWKLDRLFRSIPEFAKITKQLCDSGVRLLIPSQQIDTDNNSPMGKLMMTMLAAFAEFELDLIKERVTAGMKRAGDAGWKNGKPGPRTKNLLDITKVVELSNNGMSYRAIGVMLGVSKTTVWKILTQQPGDKNWYQKIREQEKTKLKEQLERKGVCMGCLGLDGSHDPECLEIREIEEEVER